MCRSSLASLNIWRAPRAQSAPTPALSFDGTGYLFVDKLADIPTFAPVSGRGIVRMEITTRPNVEREGLVLYAYDKDVRHQIDLSP